jgi:hypothetical protein
MRGFLFSDDASRVCQCLYIPSTTFVVLTLSPMSELLQSMVPLICENHFFNPYVTTIIMCCS